MIILISDHNTDNNTDNADKTDHEINLIAFLISLACYHFLCLSLPDVFVW